MNNIEVRNPYLAFIAIPLVAIVVLFFFHIPKQKRFWTKHIISLVLHFFIAGTLTLTFIDINYLYTSKNTELVILADCSDSELDSKDELDAVVKNIYEKVNNTTKACLVAYAESPEKVIDFGGRYDNAIKKVFDDTNFKRNSTNIEKALRYANTLYSEDTVRRLIIISDGIETDGSATLALEDLRHNEVNIECIYTRHGEKAKNEIAITNVEFVDTVFLNRTQTVKASIRSWKEEDSTVNLWKNGMVIDSLQLPISRGLNEAEFLLPTDEVGTFDYKVTVEPGTGKTALEDTYAENNTCSFTQKVTDEFKVLILKGDQSTNVRNIFINELGCFTENTDVTEYWYKDNSLKVDLDYLLSFDEYILYDVKVKEIPHYDQFVANIFTCVASYGKTLQNFGELNLDNEETEALTQYSDMLPVQVEGSSEKAVVLNVDVSGSMSGPSIEQARNGAKACVDILNDKDFLGVVSFSDSSKVVAPLSSARRNAESIKAAISRMQPEGGTQMNAGLQKSFELLSNSTFEYKYVITLSDGEPFETERELVEQVEKMASAGISCTFINILNPSGEQLLRNLADHGFGAYFYCDNTNQLVDTMIEAVGIRSLSSLIDNKVLPVGVGNADDPILMGVNTNALGSINGSYVCYRKPDAKTVLTIPYQKEGDTESGSATMTLPLFAYWRFGRGTVSSFTSNFSPWTYQFRNSAEGKKIFQNAWNNLLPEFASHDQIQFTYETRGVTSDIHIYAADPDTNAEVKVTLTGPKGDKVESQLFFDGTQYSGNVPTADIGTYSVHINYKHHITMTNGEVMMVPLGEGDYNLFFDYSSEYNVFDASDGELLYELASNREDVTVNEPNYAALSQELQYTSYRSTSLWFLIATLALFLADVFVRKGEAKKKKKPEYTVGTNLG